MADFSQWWWQAAGVDPGPGPGPDAGDPIGQSLRFRDNVPTYLSNTNLVGSTLTSYTVSCWVKKSFASDASAKYILTSGSAGTNGAAIGFNHTGTLPSFSFRESGGTAFPGSNGILHRDLSAWYHVVSVYDQPNQQVTIYINGEQQAQGSATGTPTMFRDSPIQIGLYADPSYTINAWEGYLSDFYFIDGQALQPTTFGRYNSQGVWVPVDPQGLTYGANGFKLTFEDPSDIGKDYSGNGNDFSDTGFELGNQSSPDYDLMQDSPTQNWATGNPLNSSTSLSRANLGFLENSTSYSKTDGTIAFPSTGKWQIEYRYGGSQIQIGYKDSSVPVIDSSTPPTTQPGHWFIVNNGNYFADGTQQSGAVPNSTAGDVWSMTFDADTNEAKWYQNGTLRLTKAIPAANGRKFVPFLCTYNSSNTYQFGQQNSFTHPVAGFEALKPRTCQRLQSPTGVITSRRSPVADRV